MAGEPARGVSLAGGGTLATIWALSPVSSPSPFGADPGADTRTTLPTVRSPRLWRRSEVGMRIKPATRSIGFKRLRTTERVQLRVPRSVERTRRSIAYLPTVLPQRHSL